MTAPILSLLLLLSLPPATPSSPAIGPAGQSVEALSISGTVRDATGTVLAGAALIVRSPAGAEEQTTSGPDGRFRSPAPSGDIVLIVRAEGFAEQRRAIESTAPRSNLEIVLQPATVSETVTVTAARLEQRTADVASSISVLGREAIRRSPAVVADDVLRQVPTFSLFRRTSSLAAHPTAQGVSLRGIGPSGVSRTLVLLDGVPFNDSFGGWVYWSRVPLETVEQIEIVENASSSLYGNYAMGGVINILSAPPARRTVELRTQFGSRNTPRLDVSASDVWGPARVSVEGSVFDTDGYTPVVESERGAVDNNADVGFRNIAGRIQYDVSERVNVYIRGGYFREERDNGKHSTIDGTPEANDTTWRAASGRVRVRLPGESDLQVSLFLDSTRFHSNFLAVPAAAPPRSVGRMTLEQVVPATGWGGAAVWSRPFAGRHAVTAGADWRWVDGDSEEDALDPVTGSAVTLKRVSGGTQRNVGVFVQDVFTPAARLTLTVGARVDGWRNYDGHNLETAFPSGVPTANHRPSLPEQDDTVVSPRAAAIYRLSEKVSVWGDVGRGFRAPTLNELYRQFRVGTVLTLANPELGPERLVGGNLGIRYSPRRDLFWRTTVFANRVEDPVSNVTIATAGAAVTQQRQNLGRTRIQGVQTDVEYRPGTAWRVTGAYIYNDARVREFAANPTLVGKYLPQVPRHRGSVQVAFVNPRLLTIVAGVEAVGRQYDDDQNSRIVPGYPEPGLPAYALAGFTISRSLGRNVEAFFGVQNLFDQTYYVGTLPTTVGSPRFASGGIRVRFAGQATGP
ncbi:MAG TPA: TonB-dependent receptor [Vicinamibacterales bacterium]|nr:TonB-dependent receptor [Vicinamibacterales bacterium]